MIVKIEDSLVKSYGYDNLVRKETLMEDMENHLCVYSNYVGKNIRGIIRVLTKNFLVVKKYKIETLGVKFIEPEKRPFHIPLIMSRKYHAYYQKIILSLEIEIADDLNLLKLKNYDLYSKLFERDGDYLNTRTINSITTIINSNVKCILQ